MKNFCLLKILLKKIDVVKAKSEHDAIIHLSYCTIYKR